MDLGLKDSIQLVTAASRGLGLGVARALIDEGAKVIICGRHEASLAKAVDGLGIRSQYVVADVSKREDVSHLLETISSEYGHLDGLFVNAGGPPPKKFEKLGEEDWRAAFDLTLMSAVHLTHLALPLLSRTKHPSILYSTSISVKQPLANLLLSNSLRPAVIGLMRTLADEIGPKGIRVNAVCPGYIKTERVAELVAASDNPGQAASAIESGIPLGRMGQASEFGAVCAFLLSPVASYIHGSLLLVDGGMYRGMM